MTHFKAWYIKKELTLNGDDSGNYLIDADGDGKWDYIYDHASGKSTIYALTNNDGGIPGFELIFVVCVIVFLFLGIWKRYGGGISIKIRKKDVSNDEISKSQKKEIKNNTDGEFIKEIREQMENNNLK